VQRKPEVEPLPRPEPVGEEEAASPSEAPLRAPLAPHRGGLGVLRAPSEVQRGPSGVLRRAATPPGPVPGTAVEPEIGAAGLQDKLLSRAAVRTHLPLNHGLRMAAASVQPSPAEAPEAPPSQPGEVETVLRHIQAARRAPEPAGELPLSPVVPPLVQRMATTPAVPVSAVPHPAGTVQRAEAEEAPQLAEPAEPTPPDLEKLARQVFPIIRRMLKVERERAFGR